ncbi:MAG: serine/threonine-protein kinase [Gemmatimonadales bacterium]
MSGTAPGDAALVEALAALGYRVEAHLGRGGSAEVFRARDRKHDRSVAVKVLRREVADAMELERFARELALASQLAHPHILPVFDSGVVLGLPFYVTPLIGERTLRDRLETGPLPEAEAVRIAGGIAEALEFAHRHGVVHRDIKPENVLLAGGEAIVADFGIATAIDAVARPLSGDRRLTAPGLVLGTPDYMSPEQASGDPVDARTDIYALGCVLFEMLLGRVPFGGETYTEMLADRLRVSAKRVIGDLDRFPAALGEIVARCLAAAPEARYQSAAELLAALRAIPESGGGIGRWIGRRRVWLAAGLVVVALALVLTRTLGGSPDERRLVVLPLTDETADSTLASIGALAADRIVAALAPIPGIEVVTSAVDVPSFRILRHHAAAPAATGGDGLERLRAAAAEADAGLIVSGSYYRVRDSLELIVELTQVKDGRLLRAVGPVHGLPGAIDSMIGVVATAVVSAVDSLARSR